MRRRTITLTILTFFCAVHVTLAAADIRPAQLRCEYRENPLGIGGEAPRLGWIVVATDANRRGAGADGLPDRRGQQPGAT